MSSAVGLAAEPAAASAATAPAEAIVLPEATPDPIEPVNRFLWSVNKGALKYGVQPTAKVYRTVVCSPVRTHVGYFAHNLKYPVRLVNNLFQGKWTGARDETSRFFCNTVLGLGGVFNVADDWPYPASETDFGMTLAHWGWRPGCYLMLPILGPSSERDGLGAIGDALANPVNYFSPYSYSSYGFTFNGLSDSVDSYARLAVTDKDPYATIHYASTFLRQDRRPDYTVTEPRDAGTLETLGAVQFNMADPEFPWRGGTRSVKIPATGKRLKFTVWMQRKPAPVVYIVPGLGSHRLGAMPLGLAEMAYRAGCSVVCLSNPYNYEFMENASTAAMPAYTPVDAQDLQNALERIDARLRDSYPRRLNQRVLMGYSMGAFHTLYLAAGQRTNVPAGLSFDRYVAINPPVRLLYGMEKLDEFFQAPLAWPAAERTNRVENALLKTAAISSGAYIPTNGLPYGGTESKYLVGLLFRFTLRDIIYGSQTRENQGVLREPLRKSRRAALYREIVRYSYHDYLAQFVTPYYGKRGIDLSSGDALERASDLHTCAEGLRGHPKVRVITNQNDFLLASEDLRWLRDTVGEERLTVFEHGGHLGNLARADVQRAILSAFEDLAAAPGAR